MTRAEFSHDHTLLRPDATGEQIRKLCEEAIRYQFKAVCTNSCWIGAVSRVIGGKLGIASVVGFPLGACHTKAKVEETKEAVGSGATEIDMVEANAQRIVDCVNACMGIPEPKPPQRLVLSKPKSGQPVIWLWEFAGQATAGDYYKGKPRDAAKNYEVIKDILPSHWIAWPNDWLSAKPVA